jgi:hypothetical protein
MARPDPSNSPPPDDPVLRALRQAEPDDEPVTEEERRDIREAEEEPEPGLSSEDVRRELGIE